MSFARSVIISDMEHHLNGHGDPPKVKRREMNAISLWIVQHDAAVWPQVVIRRYADAKSYFPMRIGVLG